MTITLYHRMYLRTKPVLLWCVCLSFFFFFSLVILLGSLQVDLRFTHPPAKGDWRVKGREGVGVGGWLGGWEGSEGAERRAWHKYMWFIFSHHGARHFSKLSGGIA